MPAPLPCATCRQGCSCTFTDPGCGHYGCYGRNPQDCPGVAYEAARAKLAAQARWLNHRRITQTRVAYR